MSESVSVAMVLVGVFSLLGLLILRFYYRIRTVRNLSSLLNHPRTMPGTELRRVGWQSHVQHYVSKLREKYKQHKDFSWREVLPISIVAGVGIFFLAGLAAGILAATYLAAGIVAYQRIRVRTRKRTVRMQCADALAGMADDIRAGTTSDAALDATLVRLHKTTGETGWNRVLSALRQHGDVPAALQAMPPHVHQPCTQLAAMWYLRDAGIPLAGLLEKLDSELGQWRRHTDQLSAETGAAAATGTVLALLPFVGIGLGFTLGADPLQTLFHNSLGAACAFIGAVLQLAGWFWSDRITNPVDGLVA